MSNVELIKNGNDGILKLSGVWSQNDPKTSFNIPKELKRVKKLAFDLSEVSSWDTTLIAFILKILKYSKTAGLNIDLDTIPTKQLSIVKLALAVPAKDTPKDDTKNSFLYNVGHKTEELFSSILGICDFIGEFTLSTLSIIFAKGKLRLRETFAVIQQCGPEALPIVTLISVLIGLILAYIGAIQLKQFGASIYVANLVSVAMLREMGAIMAAIVMAGRTGAAYAAQLGTMQVNEEIDALKTLGISEMGYLVLPRMLALVLMMPFLCLYADILGIGGGAIVGVLSLDLNPELYYNQTIGSITLSDLLVGMVKSSVFGVLIGLAGCLCGIKCARNASAVGNAVTKAVVTSIVAIVVADAVFAVITNVLGV